MLVRKAKIVTIATVKSTAPRGVPEEELDGIRIVRLPWFGPAGYALPRRSRVLDELVRDADVVHCFGLYNFICPMAARLCVRTDKPFVLESMGMLVPRVRSLALKRLYNATATKWMVSHASALVATSELEASEIRAAYPRTNVVVRGNGIDLDEFANLPPRDLMRHKWGVALDEFLVVYIGRISAKKRLVDLVQAFDRARLQSARLVIAGPVSEPTCAARLQVAIQSFESANRISCVDAVYEEELQAALSAADLFVLPSENENFGNAAAEAVAANLPVLLTKTCGIAPLIHLRAGYAVPLGVESLAKGIRLMMKPDFRGQVTAHREEVKRELSWDEPVAQTIALYERIIKENAEKAEILKTEIRQTRNA